MRVLGFLVRGASSTLGLLAEFPVYQRQTKRNDQEAIDFPPTRSRKIFI